MQQLWWFLKNGTIYNPLFLWGVGLGKTHNAYNWSSVLEYQSDKNVKYVSSETFANDFIMSIQIEHKKNFVINIVQ